MEEVKRKESLIRGEQSKLAKMEEVMARAWADLDERSKTVEQKYVAA